MDPYSADHKAPTATGDTFTNREKGFLGMYRANAMLRFRDTNSYYCSACDRCYGVYCPNCKIATSLTHLPDAEKVFVALNITDRWDGHTWMRITCRKCDYTFKVISV
jgi:hypothetical protein